MSNDRIPPEQDWVERNRQLQDEIQRRVRQLAAMNTVAAVVSQSLDLNQTLTTALQTALDIIHIDSAGISLVDEEAGELVLRAQLGWKKDFVSTPMRIKLGQGLSGEVITGNTIVVTGNLTGDQRLAVPAFIEEEVEALAMAPMHAGGRVIGVLSVMSHHEYQFSGEELDVLQAIADQVGVAVENARLYEEARQQEKRLAAIIQSAADAIIATDDTGRISVVNAAAQNLFELQTKRFVGMPLQEAPLQPPLLEEIRRAMRRMGTGESSTVFEVTLPSEQTLAAVLSRLHSQSPLDQRERSEGWVIVLRDTSHFKEAEAARTEFIESAAHDLRNPLGVTLSSLIMLQDFVGLDDPSAAEIFQIALEAVNQMQDLLDDLVHLEHIATGEGFEPEQTEPYALLLEALVEWEPVIRGKDQTCTLDVPQSLPVVTVSPLWFRRAVGNYLSNASKYTQEGGQIVLHARAEEDELVIEVRDNGPGIPPEAQGRLFERFYRVPLTKEKVRGTGLGLAIVKSVAEAHGGRVYARSLPKQGSVFGIVLPLTPGDGPTAGKDRLDAG